MDGQVHRTVEGGKSTWKEHLALVADIVSVIGIPVLGIYFSPQGFAEVYNRIRFTAVLLLALIAFWTLSYLIARLVVVQIFNDFLAEFGWTERTRLLTVPLVIGALLTVWLIGVYWDGILNLSHPIQVP